MANNTSDSVTILLGSGAGAFTAAPPVSLPVNSNPLALAVTDFNGDGNADIAVLNSGTSKMSVLLGNGNGTFTVVAAPAPFPGGRGLRRGRKPDLAVANRLAVTVSILLGNGDGTFSAVASSPSAGSLPASVAVADFNGDGKPDLAVANKGSDTVTILLGKGDGTFSAAAMSPTTGRNPVAVAVGDWNGDGRTDLAVANNLANTVSILLGNGNGTFSAVMSEPVTEAGPQSVAVGDFNGDGKADLSVANNLGNTVSILLGNGDGTFTAAATPTVAGSASRIHSSSLVNYAFASSTVNGSSASHTNPLTLSSGTTALAINATYRAISGTGPGAVTHFSLTPSSFTATAGVPLQFTVAALDASNATVTGCTGSVRFTSTDGSATLPADTTLTNGLGVFTASLVTPGTQTLTASDLFSPSISGTSGGITVSAPSGLRYVPVTPCRVTDTRLPAGPFGAPFIGGEGLVPSRSRVRPVEFPRPRRPIRSMWQWCRTTGRGRWAI